MIRGASVSPVFPIDACRTAGVRHLVFTSVHDARADHPLEFFRIKFHVEEYLRASGLSHTILRPTAFMEFWATLVGQPIVDRGRTTIFGRGMNPVNFVSVADVAQVLMRPFNPALSRQIAAGVYMDTEDQTLDMSDTLTRFPVRLRRLEDVVRAQYGQPH